MSTIGRFCILFCRSNRERLVCLLTIGKLQSSKVVFFPHTRIKVRSKKLSNPDTGFPGERLNICHLGMVSQQSLTKIGDGFFFPAHR